MNGSWIAVCTILLATLMFGVVCSIAASNGLVVFDGSKADLSVVLLTAATVVLTGVAVIMALFGFWGYGELRSSAVRLAVEEARKTARETARSVAQTVVARSKFEVAAEPDGTTPEEAQKIVEAQEAELGSQSGS